MWVKYYSTLRKKKEKKTNSVEAMKIFIEQAKFEESTLSWVEFWQIKIDENAVKMEKRS